MNKLNVSEQLIGSFRGYVSSQPCPWLGMHWTILACIIIHAWKREAI